jgi:hypothetical protein
VPRWQLYLEIPTDLWRQCLPGLRTRPWNKATAPGLSRHIGATHVLLPICRDNAVFKDSTWKALVTLSHAPQTWRTVRQPVQSSVQFLVLPRVAYVDLPACSQLAMFSSLFGVILCLFWLIACEAANVEVVVPRLSKERAVFATKFGDIQMAFFPNVRWQGPLTTFTCQNVHKLQGPAQVHAFQNDMCMARAFNVAADILPGTNIPRLDVLISQCYVASLRG